MDPGSKPRLVLSISLSCSLSREFRETFLDMITVDENMSLHVASMHSRLVCSPCVCKGRAHIVGMETCQCTLRACEFHLLQRGEEVGGGTWF